VAIRNIRVRHLKGVFYDPKWTSFKTPVTALLFLGIHSAHLLEVQLKLHALFVPSQ
jgi:hypothetical protein